MGHIVTFLISVASLCSLSLSTSSTTCERPSSTPQVWREKNVDQHLRTYPDGNQLSFEDYVKHLRIDQFTCGIGKESGLTEAMRCSTLISDADWLVLQSVQSWNHYANVIFYEIQKADNQSLQDIVASILRALQTTYHMKSKHRKRAMEVTGEKLAAVVLDKNSQVNVELRPDVMAQTIKKPLVEHLVPEAGDFRFDKLPALWVRTLRYAREAIDRGLTALRMGPAKRLGSYYPAPYGPEGKSLLPAREELKSPELQQIKTMKAQKLREWQTYYEILTNPSESTDKQIQKSTKKKLQKAVREWHHEHVAASKEINNLLSQQSEESLNKYKQEMNDIIELKNKREAVKALLEEPSKPLARGKSFEKDMQNIRQQWKQSYDSLDARLAKLHANQQKPRLVEEEKKLPKWKFTVPKNLSRVKNPGGKSITIQAPPPPPFFKLHDLFRKRSAQVAYKLKRIGERWRNLYESKFMITNDPELAAQTDSELLKLQSTWHELNQKYISLKKAESMQAAIDEGATKEERKQKQLLVETRQILSELDELANKVEGLRLLHGNRADEELKKAAKPIMAKIFSHPVSETKPAASPKKLTKRSTDFNRETNGQPQAHSTGTSNADEFIHKHGPELLLRLASLIQNNVRLTLSNPISGDLLSSIKDGLFLQKVESNTIMEDEKFLLELGVLSQLLHEMNVTISYGVRTCDPSSESLTISRSGQTASSCGANGILRTISSESTVAGGVKLMENLSNFAKSRGYQLSTLIDLALACDIRIDPQTWRSASELPSTPHPFSNGISLCIFKLPVHRHTP